MTFSFHPRLRITWLTQAVRGHCMSRVYTCEQLPPADVKQRQQFLTLIWISEMSVCVSVTSWSSSWRDFFVNSTLIVIVEADRRGQGGLRPASNLGLHAGLSLEIEFEIAVFPSPAVAIVSMHACHVLQEDTQHRERERERGQHQPAELMWRKWN